MTIKCKNCGGLREVLEKSKKYCSQYCKDAYLYKQRKAKKAVSNG